MCPNCGEYLSITIEYVPGKGDVEITYCPYCGYTR